MVEICWPLNRSDLRSTIKFSNDFKLHAKLKESVTVTIPLSMGKHDLKIALLFYLFNWGLKSCDVTLYDITNEVSFISTNLELFRRDQILI